MINRYLKLNDTHEGLLEMNEKTSVDHLNHFYNIL